MGIHDRATHYRIALHGYAIAVVIAAGVLLYTGGVVTTIGAGLAVPDWPLSFGSLNPDGWWQDRPVRAEHGHRLFAAFVGLLIAVLAGGIIMTCKRRWLKVLAGGMVLAVIIQAVLGGLRVIDQNLALAMVHGSLAHLLFAGLVIIAWSLSRTWQITDARKPAPRNLRGIAIAASVAIYLQLILGAIMRHSNAGMAIPTYPLNMGGLLPPYWTLPVALNFAHRLVGLLVAGLGLALLIATWNAKAYARARFAARLTAALIVVQIAFGGATVLLHRAVVPTTLHVVVGALTLAAAVSTVLLLYRPPLPNPPEEHETQPASALASS